MVIVSGRLHLPWDAPLFTEGHGRVLVATTSDAEPPELETPVEVLRQGAGSTSPRAPAPRVRRPGAALRGQSPPARGADRRQPGRRAVRDPRGEKLAGGSRPRPRRRSPRARTRGGDRLAAGRVGHGRALRPVPGRARALVRSRWSRSWAASSTSLCLRGPVVAGDQSRAVQAPEVAMHERVPGLGLVGGAVGEAEVPPGVVAPRVRGEELVLVRGARLHLAQSLSYWRASISSTRACATPAWLTE